MLFSLGSFSQEDNKESYKLKLTVRDANNKAVPGAVILIDGVKQNRLANSKGVFKIKLDKKPEEISAFSPSIGLKKVSFDDKEEMIIILEKDNTSYLVDTSREKVSTSKQFLNIYDYLRGKVPGVTISGNNEIAIRGASTFYGSREPLYILNGVQIDKTTFGNIVPTDIKSVKIIKGPETAIYGIRGANGIIQVTTLD